MPYDKISDLPREQVDQYSHHQKEAFLAAFNNAYEEYHHDEHRAFAVAHHAAISHSISKRRPAASLQNDLIPGKCGVDLRLQIGARWNVDDVGFQRHCRRQRKESGEQKVTHH